MLLRALVPAGFMPDLGALKHGVYTLTICSGSVQKSVLVDADGAPVGEPAGPVGHPGTDHDEAPCAFAALSHLVYLVGLVAGLLLLLRPIRAWRRPATASLDPPRHWKALGARAPPALRLDAAL
jgi:hypothetical protein